MKRRLGGSLRDRKVAVLGLTFKRDTDDARDSLSHKLIRLLERELADVALHDPLVAAPTSAFDDAVAAPTPWSWPRTTPRTPTPGAAHVAEVPRSALLVDPWNVTGDGPGVRVRRRARVRLLMLVLVTASAASWGSTSQTTARRTGGGHGRGPPPAHGPRFAYEQWTCWTAEAVSELVAPLAPARSSTSPPVGLGGAFSGGTPVNRCGTT